MQDTKHNNHQYRIKFVSSRVLCLNCGDTSHFVGKCHTFKTKKCRYYHTGCYNGNDCSFVHNESPRQQTKVCKKVVQCLKCPLCRDSTKLHAWVYGCGSTDHTYDTCPFNKKEKRIILLPPDQNCLERLPDEKSSFVELFGIFVLYILYIVLVHLSVRDK